ncbi:MAG TPA: efflux RND transporter permease subunit, partial [Kofleriaceae bacterium]|nr:efflux RND transporter permease subunit [Kofleriaceae bacterium]
MIDKLLHGSLSARLLVFILAVFLAAAGWYSYRNLTIEAFPDPTDTQVQIITLYSGQPTEEVERRVSIPLERALNGVPGLFRLRSISLFGLSQLTLTFQDGIDPLVARQQIMERIPDANLPQGISPDLGPLATPIGEVYRYSLDGPGADPMTLRTVQDWIVRPALMRVPGVADVVSYGGLVEEIHVEPQPVKLAALGVVLDDVFQALSKASANASGGTLERGAQVFVIRSLGTFREAADIAKVRVGFHAGVPVKLGDVATVTVGYAPRQGVVTRGNNLDTVEGIVLMRRGENPSVVLAALRDRIAELDQRALPGGIQLRPFYDRTDLVDTTLDTVFHNLG